MQISRGLAAQESDPRRREVAMSDLEARLKALLEATPGLAVPV
jgi:hypothetical protein